MLLGRSSELSYLNQCYQKNGSRIVVVYGQKHIGKTALVKEFCKNKPFHYFHARSCSEREQRFLWGGECGREGIYLAEHPSYTEILQSLIRGQSEKMILVIDEFQHMLKTDSGFIQELAAFAKSPGKMQDVLIILCSSSVGFVENSLVSRIGDAAFLLSGFLKTKELRFEHLSSYFQEYSIRECAEIYAVLGGFPGLWKHLDNKGGIKETLIHKLLVKDGFLLREAERYVSEELRETGVYYTILTALASGKQKLNELYLHTNFSRAKISVYLKSLMELELVEKVYSYDTDGKSNAKKGIYSIKNPLVYFYFRFIYPNLSCFYTMSSEDFFDGFIKEDFNSHVEPALRRICLEQLNVQNEKKELPICFVKSGEWVGKIGTIDIVAQDENGRTLIALCNYKKPVLAYDDYEWICFLAKKARLKPEYIYLYSIGDFDVRLKKIAKQRSEVKLIRMPEKRSEE